MSDLRECDECGRLAPRHELSAVRGDGGPDVPGVPWIDHVCRKCRAELYPDWEPPRITLPPQN